MSSIPTFNLKVECPSRAWTSIFNSMHVLSYGIPAIHAIYPFHLNPGLQSTYVAIPLWLCQFLPNFVLWYVTSMLMVSWVIVVKALIFTHIQRSISEKAFQVGKLLLEQNICFFSWDWCLRSWNTVGTHKTGWNSKKFQGCFTLVVLSCSFWAR